MDSSEEASSFSGHADARDNLVEKAALFPLSIVVKRSWMHFSLKLLFICDCEMERNMNENMKEISCGDIAVDSFW